MISAQEARDLIAQSEETVNFYLTKVDPMVRKAIADNKRQAFLYVTDLWECVPQHDKVEPSLSQRAVMRKLEALGYGVKFGIDNDPGATYVPRGLANDEGQGPIHSNVGITLSW